jgi:hypothetical protein
LPSNISPSSCLAQAGSADTYLKDQKCERI